MEGDSSFRATTLPEPSHTVMPAPVNVPRPVASAHRLSIAFVSHILMGYDVHVTHLTVGAVGVGPPS